MYPVHRSGTGSCRISRFVGCVTQKALLSLSVAVVEAATIGNPKRTKCRNIIQPGPTSNRSVVCCFRRTQFRESTAQCKMVQQGRMTSYESSTSLCGWTWRGTSVVKIAFNCICICIVVVFVFVLRRTSFGSGTTVWRRLNARWQV